LQTDHISLTGVITHEFFRDIARVLDSYRRLWHWILSFPKSDSIQAPISNRRNNVVRGHISYYPLAVENYEIDLAQE
jgi:hypothetical protein